MRILAALLACAVLCPTVTAQDKVGHLGPRTSDGPPEFKTYSVPSGEADVVAKLLQKKYQSTSGRRIEAIGRRSILVYAVPDEHGQIAKVISERESRMASAKASQNRPQREREQQASESSQLASQLLVSLPAKKAREKSGAERPGRSDLPVNILVFGSKLIATSHDPEALATFSRLTRLLTQTQAGEGDFWTFRLKHVNAMQAALELEEMFNGPMQRGQENATRSKPTARGSGVPGKAEPHQERIRVVADPGTDLLIVKADPLDLLTIRSLLTKVIDTEDNDLSTAIRTWTIRLKHASAQTVARILHDVYGESINNKSVVATVGGIPGLGLLGMRMRRNGSGGGVPVGTPLDLGVDDQTNTLVLHCSQEMYEEVSKLVMQLDRAAANASRAVKVISIKGVDPQMVQLAIDTIQGRAKTGGSAGPARSATRTGR